MGTELKLLMLGMWIGSFFASVQGRAQAMPPKSSVACESAEAQNSYDQAISSKNAKVRSEKLREFVEKYHKLKTVPCLELLSRAYTELGQFDDLEKTLKQVVALDSNNLPALTTLVRFCEEAEFVPDAEKFNIECDGYAGQGLNALELDKPSGGRQNAERMFASQLGVSALRKNDYPQARRYLQTAVDLTPNDFSVVYPLALAYLRAPQADCKKGLWYIARASILAPTPNYRVQIRDFGRKKMIEFDGDETEWKQILEEASKSASPTANLAISCSAK